MDRDQGRMPVGAERGRRYWYWVRNSGPWSRYLFYYLAYLTKVIVRQVPNEVRVQSRSACPSAQDPSCDRTVNRAESVWPWVGAWGDSLVDDY